MNTVDRLSQGTIFKAILHSILTEYDSLLADNSDVRLGISVGHSSSLIVLRNTIKGVDKTSHFLSDECRSLIASADKAETHEFGKGSHHVIRHVAGKEVSSSYSEDNAPLGRLFRIQWEPELKGGSVIDTPAIAGIIHEEFLLHNYSGPSTPTVFINGERYIQGQSPDKDQPQSPSTHPVQDP